MKETGRLWHKIQVRRCCWYILRHGPDKVEPLLLVYLTPSLAMWEKRKDAVWAQKRIREAIELYELFELLPPSV